MSIESICRRSIVTIDEQATLHDAAARMRAEHVGALVVTTSDGSGFRVVGIVTDRDLAIEILARDLEPSDLRVGHLAQRDLVAVPADAGIVEAVTRMRQAGVRRLLVTSPDGRLAGIVTSDDLVEALAGELGGLAGALRAGLERETAERDAIAPPMSRPTFLPQGTAGWHA